MGRGSVQDVFYRERHDLAGLVRGRNMAVWRLRCGGGRFSSVGRNFTPAAPLPVGAAFTGAERPKTYSGRDIAPCALRLALPFAVLFSDSMARFSVRRSVGFSSSARHRVPLLSLCLHGDVALQAMRGGC